jgi:hypothetical protein
MTIKEIIQRVQSLYSKGIQSDETRLRSRHIFSKVKTARVKLLTQSVNKKQKISPWNYQLLPCVELEEIEANQCPCIVTSTCTILRSKYKLPKIISSYSSNMIQSVTSIDRSRKIDEVSPNNVKHLVGNKYTKDNMYFFLENGYIYIVGHTNISTVSVIGLFEDPIEAYVFQSPCTATDECLNILDFNFPIDLDSIDTIVEMAMAELVNTFIQVKEDTLNNSTDR